MKQQNLEFLLHSDIEPKKIKCSFFHFRSSSTVDYSKQGREQNIIHLMLRGKREYTFDGKRFTFEEHSVIFIPDCTNYTTVCEAPDGQACEGISILFSINDPILQSIPHGVYKIDTYAKSELERKFFELYELCTTMPTQILKQKALTLEIIYAFVSKLNTSEGNSRLISPALEYIAKHYKENISVSEYAAVCNMSESYFRKKFLEATGFSPIKYRNQLRFVEAKRLYQNGYTMKAIAEELGFCDENYLSKLYKRHNGKSLKEDVELL